MSAKTSRGDLWGKAMEETEAEGRQIELRSGEWT